MPSAICLRRGRFLFRPTESHGFTRIRWDGCAFERLPPVLGVYLRALLAFYARTARAHGIRADQTGTATVPQRFGSGRYLDAHFHALALDAVFSEARRARLSPLVSER